MAEQRFARASSATLVVVTTDADGDPADPGGTTATVAVTRADGTTLVASSSATHVETGKFSYALTAAQTATLDLLNATWTFPNSTTKATTAEIAGGWYCSPGEARLVERLDPKLSDPEIRRARLETEDEFERICDRAFVPRYARLVVDGDGSGVVNLPVCDIRTVRTVTVLAAPGSASSSTVTAVIWPTSNDPTRGAPGTLTRTDGGVFTEGAGTVIVELEHGLSAPPPDLKRAAIARIRYRLVMANSAPAQRASKFSTPDGQTFDLATGDAWATGIADIDSVLDRYSRRRRGKSGGNAKPAPASRPMRLAAQRSSLFHTGGAGP